MASGVEIVVRVMGTGMAMVMVIRLQIQFEEMKSGGRDSRLVRILLKCKISNVQLAERFHISSVAIGHCNNVIKLPEI